MRSRWPWPALVAVVAISACTSGHAAPRPSVVPRPTPSHQPTFVVSRVASFDLPTGPVSLTLLDGGRVAYAIGDGERNDRVEVFEPSTGQRLVVGRTAYPGGIVARVRGGGDYLVWVEESRPDDQDSTVRWTMRSLQVRTGRVRVIASSGSEATAEVPSPEVNDGTAVWSLPASTGLGMAELRLLDLATGRELLRRVGAVSDAVTTAAGYAVGFVPGHGGLDVVAFGMTQPSLRALTDGGGGDTYLAAGGTRVAWVEDDPGATTRTPDRIMVADLGSDAAPRLAVPGPSRGNPVVGGSFLGYVGADSRITVTGFDGRARPVVASDDAVDVAGGLAALGDLLTYSERVGGSGAVRVFLDRVTPDGAA